MVDRFSARHTAREEQPRSTRDVAMSARIDMSFRAGECPNGERANG